MSSITVPMEKNLRDQLEKAAKNKDRSLAYIVREACSLFLNGLSDTQTKPKRVKLK